MGLGFGVWGCGQGSKFPGLGSGVSRVCASAQGCSLSKICMYYVGFAPRMRIGLATQDVQVSVCAGASPAVVVLVAIVCVVVVVDVVVEVVAAWQ